MGATTMNFALVFDSDKGFYCGAITNVAKIDTTRTYSYTYSVGFIMTYTIDANSCVKGGTYTLSSSSNNALALILTTHSTTS